MKNCFKKISRKTLFIIVGVLLFVLTLLIVAVIILITMATSNTAQLDVSKTTTKNQKEPDVVTKQSWSDPSRPRNCAKSEYLQPHPPLVIISLNGLSKSLLQQNFDTLRKIGNSGVTAMSVFPCFSAQNLTNRIAISTGLFPVSQNFGSFAETRQSNESEPFKQPIWSAYKNQTGGIAALHSWPLHPFENAYLPDYYIPKDSSTFEEQLKKVVAWLKMDSSSRPGLIMLSCDQIQEAFRSRMDESVTFNSFLTELNDNTILDCINMAVVSDEGVSNGTTHFNIQQFNVDDIEPGTVSLLGTNGSDTTNTTSSLYCQKENARILFLPSTVPNRWHYNGFEDNADVIVLARRNLEKCRGCKQRENLSLSGFDYLDEGMQTAFYAQGPSFKGGVILPAFQNVEYMNLWLDLLNLNYVPNNGTVGFMDEILNKPIRRIHNNKFGIRECPFTNGDHAVNCGGCTALQLVRVANWMNNCIQPRRPIVMLSSSSSLPCYQKICEKLIVKGQSSEGESLALVELFHPNNTMAKSQTPCQFVSSRYEFECPIAEIPSGLEPRSLSADPKKVLAHIATIQVPWNTRFIKDVLDSLNEYTIKISKELGRVISITGTAYDRNFDGIADDDKTGLPSHLYRVIITCTSGWTQDGFACRNPWSARVLAFIFPHMDGDANCLSSRDLLLQYTARLKDVELISGMSIDLPGVPPLHALHLRISLASQLW